MKNVSFPIFILVLLFSFTACSKEPKNKEYYKNNLDKAEVFLGEKCVNIALRSTKDSKLLQECKNAEMAIKERNAEIEVLQYCENIYKIKPARSLYNKECKRIDTEIKANQWDYTEFNGLLGSIELLIDKKYSGTPEYIKEQKEKEVLSYCSNQYKEKSITNVYVKECRRIEAEIKDDKWDTTEWSSRPLIPLMPSFSDKAKYYKAEYYIDPLVLKKYGQETFMKDKSEVSY